MVLCMQSINKKMFKILPGSKLLLNFKLTLKALYTKYVARVLIN